jgi:hypothetical protein
MIAIQKTKIVGITPPAAIVDNAAFTTAAVDTKGWKHCRIIAYIGATDIAFAGMKVQECDTSGGSYADVTGAVFGTSTNTAGSTSAVPSATDDDKFFCVDIPLNGTRKRFLDLVATGGDGTAGTYMTAFAILSIPESAPDTAAEEGFDEVLRLT